jgi:hypothetical protein
MEAFANMLKIGLGYIADIPHGVLGFILVLVVVIYVVRNVLD